MNGRVQTGTAADVVGELRLQGLAAEAMGDRALLVRGTALGDILLWTRRDTAHFTDAMGYPRPFVPVVDADLWEVEAPRPRCLLVASAAVRTIIVCPVKTTRASWVRQAVTSQRGYMPVWACPRDQMQPLGWLKKFLMGGRA